MRKAAPRLEKPAVASSSHVPDWIATALVDTSTRAGIALADWNREISRFVDVRIRSGRQLQKSLTNCRSWSEALLLQRDWVTRATEDYVDQGVRLQHLALAVGSRAAASDKRAKSAPRSRP
ncbi:MAG TPA: hypothetical protein VFE34_15745 [Dongiaceae bacterium]|jgi:hypothetical protein|nr:hypothetical protein [Dongiaceae bacterium]